MLEWIIIGVMIVIALFVLRVKHFKHRFYVIFLIILIVFFYVSVSRVVSENSLNLRTFDGLMSAGKIYFSWLVHAAGNVKTISGNVINLDWKGNLTKVNITGK
jgi:hypothetical protein